MEENLLIVTADQMKEIESQAEAYDITPSRLMENAGSAAAKFIRKVFPVKSLNCIVFCGKGNNGGDGFVVARRLYENGANVVVVTVEGKPATPQAEQMIELLSPLDIPVLSIEDNRALVENYSKHADLLVDAVFGIGFRGERLPTSSLIACQIMNDAPAAVVSLDSPSGVSSDRGEVAFGAVNADFTVVFQLLKPLHILPQSLEQCGELEVVEIGIPPQIIAKTESHFSFTSKQMVWDWLPTRLKDSHKGSFGKVLVICGSENYPGAAILAVTGALRVGTGLCTIAAPKDVCNAVINRLPEATIQPLPMAADGQVDFVIALPLIDDQIKTADVILFGSGVGKGSHSENLLEHLIKNVRTNLVLDADALTLLSEHLDYLKQKRPEIIITPHPKEMASLMETTTSEVQLNRMTAALDFAEYHNLTVVLKGHGTLISRPDGRLLVNESGGHGLAKGGSGDLLGGMIAGLWAQGITADRAAAAGVWLHGSAGDLCEKRLSSRAMLPTDIVDDLPALFLEYERWLEQPN